jgi:hypothetical protein
VRFIPDGKNSTRVELEHRRLDRYGARRDEMRTIFDKPATGVVSSRRSPRPLLWKDRADDKRRAPAH